MPKFVVYAWLSDTGPIPCNRPYPRSGNHQECFGFPTYSEAEKHRDKLRKQFPDNRYEVQTEGGD